ncbi:hypothetical protein [Streptomyces sp. NPDC059009]|uniref:hypothetical protein n=1 Tax=Streptomyces sp. NPDC059009 TaxID=3346694 RepID=UPI0036ADE9AC
MSGPGWFAVVRAGAFTALCVTLSTTSQVWMSHAPLPPSTLAVAVLGVFAAAVVLARRSRPFWQVAAVLVPVQLGLGAVFTAGQASCATALSGGGQGGMPCGGESLGGALAVHGPEPLGGPCLLLTVHLLIGVLAAWWLHRGEQALVRLAHDLAPPGLRTLRTLLRLLSAGGTYDGPRLAPVRPVAADRDRPRSFSPRHHVVRRGPPGTCPAL